MNKDVKYIKLTDELKKHKLKFIHCRENDDGSLWNCYKIEGKEYALGTDDELYLTINDVIYYEDVKLLKCVIFDGKMYSGGFNNNTDDVFDDDEGPILNVKIGGWNIID